MASRGSTAAKRQDATLRDRKAPPRPRSASKNVGERQVASERRAPLRVVEQVKAMQAWSRARRREGARIALVPTMGALHAGHLSLIEIARRRADKVVVSIFVNPSQFDRADDFARYPRDLAGDCALLERAGVDLVFAPGAEEMYPLGAGTTVTVEKLAAPLCGAHRPGHFRGVATVVLKLFSIVQPDVAIFGEKDYQQLAVIRRMTADLHLPITIVGAPIVREPDGLAMSSRNRHLGAEERAAARCLARALEAAESLAASGERTVAALVAAASREIAREPRVRSEYVAVVDPETLEGLTRLDERGVLALAVWIGTTRLIDNRLLTGPAAGRKRRHP